ncbi:MAG: hypothetical protein JKY65_06840 [Planctomycetes bacterium]|nr:hypothetical protein [Planctomycetota bacterium]
MRHVSILLLFCACLLGCDDPEGDPAPAKSPARKTVAPAAPSKAPLSPTPSPSLAPAPSATPPAPTPTPQPAAAPSPSETPKASPAPVVSAAPAGPLRPITKGGVDRFPGLRIFPQEGRIEVDGFVNLNRCPTLEFMACTRRGKTHETLLRFECDPEHLHLALLMLGLEPKAQVNEEGERIALEEGERVVIDAAWWARHTPPKDATAPKAVNGVVRRRVEDLIFDQRKQRSMPRVGWVFTGSQMVKVPVAPDWEKLKEVYAASYEGNIVATYHHPFVILDTPLIEGGDDTVYVPFSSRVPKKGTPVTVHIRIVEEEEAKELRAAQKSPSKRKPAPAKPVETKPGDKPSGGTPPAPTTRPSEPTPGE